MQRNFLCQSCNSRSMLFRSALLLFSSSLFQLCDSANFVFLHSAGRPENLQILSPVARGLSARGHSVSSVRYDGLILMGSSGIWFREFFSWYSANSTGGWGSKSPFITSNNQWLEGSHNYIWRQAVELGSLLSRWGVDATWVPYLDNITFLVKWCYKA